MNASEEPLTASAPTYLQRLTSALVVGAAAMPADVRRRHADWLLRQQRADGGFAGREGDSDAYYTAFALRGLMVLNAIDESVAARAADFLRSRLSGRESIIDLISIVFGAAILELSAGQVVLSDEDDSWRRGIADLLESLRTEDGGFAKTPEGRAGSTYQTFLSVLCLELIEMPIANPESIVAFIESQACQGGGFLEIRAGKRPGVNPTAAAIGTMRCLGALDRIDAAANVDFLIDQQSDEGGLAANTRIPFADLLSTFTGLWTLTELADELPSDSLDRWDRFDLGAAHRYVRSMQSDPAGFIGFALDQTADVEYTFYGLGGWALCELAGSSSPPSESSS